MQMLPLMPENLLKEAVTSPPRGYYVDIRYTRDLIYHCSYMYMY